MSNTSTERLRSSRLRARSSSFKYRNRQDAYVQVTNFLLGGNITDPLNLSSIDSNDQNQITPISSPILTPQHSREIDILIPADASDPLKLNNLGEIKEPSELCHLLISPNKIISAHSNAKRTGALSKRKRTESDSIVSDLVKDEIVMSKRMKLDTKSNGNKSSNQKDKIVSPVKPQTTCSSNSNYHNKRLSTNNVNSSSFLHSAPPHHVDHHVTNAPQSQNNAKQHQSSCDSINRRPFIFQNNQNQQFYYAKGRKINVKSQRNFQYGNYNRYYGYRNQNQNVDLRLSQFKREWFQDKSVLDIGCNVGFVTYQIARDHRPKKIVGLDIDGELIKNAKRNIRHYMNGDNAQNGVSLTPCEHNETMNENQTKSSNDDFPVSLTICHGPLSEKEVNKEDENKVNKQSSEDHKKVDDDHDDDKLKSEHRFTTNNVSSFEFPNNIQFIAANYVLPNDDLLAIQKPEYDCILCLSVTKWVHLNFGDQGLKRMFKRIYKQLNTDGVLVLEPQPIWSYKRKKAITETTLKNYNSIQFKPDQFKDFLLSDEVGFTSCETIDAPNHNSKGFRRPIFIFHK